MKNISQKNLILKIKTIKTSYSVSTSSYHHCQIWRKLWYKLIRFYWASWNDDTYNGTEDDSKDVKEYSEPVNDVYSQYKHRTVKLKFSKPHSPIYYFPAILIIRSHAYVTHLSNVCDTVDLQTASPNKWKNMLQIIHLNSLLHNSLALQSDSIFPVLNSPSWVISSTTGFSVGVTKES